MPTRSTIPPTVLTMLALLAIAMLSVSAGEEADRGTYRSPAHLAISPDGLTLYAADQTSRAVVVLDTANSAKVGQIAAGGRPEGLALSADGQRLYVAEHGAGSVAVVDTARRRVVSRIAVGRWPSAVGVDDRLHRLYIANRDRHSVSVIDLSGPEPVTVCEIGVRREPSCVAVTADGRRVVVTNQLPLGRGTDSALAAEVSLIDAERLAVAATVKLPPGSTVVNGACTSPDGHWAYVVHGLGRFTLPVTQLERGWVNTSALSIIDLAEGRRLATVLLDDLLQGAANPHSVVCSADGKRLWISHSGVHEISMVDIGRVHSLLAGNRVYEVAMLRDGELPNVWSRIQQGQASVAELENDLAALYVAGAIRRAASGGNGPRGMVLAPDGETLYVANYYAGSVGVLDAEDGAPRGAISLGPQPAADATRRGEMAFHDATSSFQRWHSCASCHPNQGRSDGLRWDFLRDGIGNGKDTPSLVLVDKTPPLNRRATRTDTRHAASTSVSAGHFTMPTRRDDDDLTAYLVSLRPEANPYRAPDGRLTEAARRGQALFEGKADCAHCHPAPYYTDQKMHSVGVLSENEPDGMYDTPSLVEGHRTGPYLHDGRATTLRDVFAEHNPRDEHGTTSGLTKQELDDLVAFLRSL